MVKVSIIIPAYNRRNLISGTLKSVYQQSYKNYEVIVVDDGSTDNTHEVLEEYTKRDNFIYHYQNNQGRSVARNTGLAKASGEFIMFLDSDDYLEPDAIETLVNLSEEYPLVNIFAASYRLIEEDILGNKREIYKREFEYINENILLQQVKMMILNIGNNIIRKQLIGKYRGFEPGLDYAEDWKLLVNICSEEKAVVIKKVILNVLRHENNSSFFQIQNAIIKIAEQFLIQIQSKEFLSNSSVKHHQIKAELNKRIAMAYNRKGNKLLAFQYFISAIRHAPLLIIDLSFIKELAFIFIPANLLIYIRRLQLKIGSKEIS